jgi:mono/diheme cytochrome c family protein
MTDTNPTNAPVRTDAPVTPTGGDSVQDLHRAHMAQMNDPVMLTADGVEAPEQGADSVQAMHDVLMREQAEPRDGFEPVPFWVAVVCGGLLMWGGFYVGSNSADFRRDVFDDPSPVARPVVVAKEPDPQTVDEYVAIGAKKYSTCAACHQPDGTGKPAENIPPLKGSNWVVGDQASAARLSRIVLHGLKGPIEVKAPGATRTNWGEAAMPPHAEQFKDYEIAGLLNYIRNGIQTDKADKDNAKPLVTTALVRAARAKDGKREQVTAAELLSKFPPDYADPPVGKK